ncbi:heat shock protein 27-like [Neocloeon triangulifer]|uniref:heat shock protein 27-like n=1 Tax=Neocloeon triangulifer TaxID=2078957 RepID=UPI00286ED4EE|nr:heat shock protein 27-like [Neocloeon triangulifer]
MSALMLFLNDVVIPLTQGLVEESEKQQKEKPTGAVEPVVRKDTLVGPRSLLEGVTYEDNGLMVKLDVRQFKPEEIRVSTDDEGTLTVEGKHEEQEDEHGFISRHFIRRFTLPKDIDMDRSQVSLSADGQLKIHAPKIDKPLERVIPIKFTNAPALASQMRRKVIM